MARARTAQRPPRMRPVRARRVVLLVAVFLAVPALVSYGSMLTQPSDSSWSIRSVEWLRDNGARGLVNKVESIYYSLNAPATDQVKGVARETWRETWRGAWREVSLMWRRLIPSPPFTFAHPRASR